MAKLKTRYVCNACGAASSQWFGQCSGCAQWGTLIEEIDPNVAAPSPAKARAHRSAPSSGSRHRSAATPVAAVAAVKLSDIRDRAYSRFSSGFSELDRVLGGGLVPGSLVLVGGDPGIGKSTLLLQVASALSHDRRILYVCAEESGQQVKLRADRLALRDTAQPDHSGASDPAAPVDQVAPADQNLDQNPDQNLDQNDQASLYIQAETSLDAILAELTSLRPAVAVIDSIQALYWSELASAPGSVAQVRECTSALMRLAKTEEITLLIVGHVTKEGAIAGPKVLEHLVDTVLYFEGDRFASFRLVRSVKNRFGATHELGVFEMVDRGLRQVANPSALFLGNREAAIPGTATIVACEGTRPIVAEIQALISATSYASPRRVTTGLGYNRLLQILAVLEKRLGIPLSRLDAYVSTSGGLSVEEPAADLGVAIALVASFRDRIVDPRTVAIGEVGLGGQVRSVSQLELRLKEAAKLGFKRAIVPHGQAVNVAGMTIVPVMRLVDAIATAMAQSQAADTVERLTVSGSINPREPET